MIVEQMTDLIGNTPMLKIDPKITGLKNVDVYIKLEMMNPFGSVKDRTAWAMVKDDLEMIKSRNMTIYENSSGNTAKSLQAIAGIHDIEFRLVSALAKVEEQKQVLQVMGAGIEEVVGASDCFDPSDANDPQYHLERAARNNPNAVYFPSQFTNEKNPDYHEQTTAQEIVDDLGEVDYFFGGLGTTGSSLGITRRLRSVKPDMVSIGVVPNASEFMPGVRSLSQMWESGLFRREEYNDFMVISEQEAVEAMLVLVRRCGVLCGPTSGSNFAGALKYLRGVDGMLDERRKAVFIACDRMEWYLSYIRERRPDLFGEARKDNSLFLYEEKPLSQEMEIDAEYADAFIAQDKTMVVDIRTAQSFAMVNMPGSVSMPVELFRTWIDGQNPFPKGTRVLLVCAVGEKSRYYAGYLRSLGCDAYNLSGGIMAWRDQAQRPRQAA